jgi:aminomethyltransferase
MSSRQLNVISHCAKSPWFSRTWNENAFYSEYAGRLVLQSLGGDAVEEYWTLRKAVGLFDVPERPLEISGKDAVAFLNRVLTRPVDKLRVGRGSYGLLCHQGGGLVCDGILFRLTEDRFWYVHADADVYLWLVAHAVDYGVEIRDPGSWVLQVQGPKSLHVLARACDGGAPRQFRYFDVFEGSMGGQPVLVSRTGWSAELGFEVYNLDAGVDGPALWDHLLAAGADQGMRACGQMSMNIRRIEAGILNYRTDMDWHTTPYDMGLGAFVDLDGHDFIGRDALRNADKASRFTGFRCDPRQIRYGAAVTASSRAIGRVTAYEVSPYLECGVGFALLDSANSLDCGDVTIEDRDGKPCPVEFVALPFYDVDKHIPRGLPSTDDITD